MSVHITNTDDKQHRAILQKIARRAMIDAGLLPDFSSQAIAELNGIHDTLPTIDASTRDLRNLLWCSIDNDDSRDLDQLSVAEALPDGTVKVLVAIADVESAVKLHSALDEHARQNTTSVYTAAEIFPMLPEKLSTDLTSLNFASDRFAFVIEMVVATDGSLQRSDVYRAIVRNQAKLAYNSVAAWLEESGEMPPALAAVKGLGENIRLQYTVAQKLKALRHQHGALDFETLEARPVFEGDEVKDIQTEKKNSAKDIIEDFMITANGITARFIEAKGLPSIRRVVKTPKRWDRIIEIAKEHNFKLPVEPDSKALEAFLTSAKTADSLRFTDLCLSVIKLLGAGEYVVELPGGESAGHFGLAVKDYAHSTAPNRRYPDLITQRIVKAALGQGPQPYTADELETLATHCTANENAAKKVERHVEKSAAALVLQSRIHEQFDAIVTGASAKGTWVRLFHPPVEGKLVSGFENLDVGHKVRVELLHTDVEQGFIDFKAVG